MARVIDSSEIPTGGLEGRVVAIVGYGNQGRAHALNLRDSGIQVIVCQRPGKSFDHAVEDGFAPVQAAVAVDRAEVLMFSLPDERFAGIYQEHFVGRLTSRHTVLFAHGYNVVFGDSFGDEEEFAIAMVSPKGAGYGVRQKFVEGSGVPALVAVHHDPRGGALSIALAYAAGLGCARNLILETSFREETVTDLFGEQAVLCGGIPELINAGYETLVAAGYSPEVAYFECLHETKLIVDLIVASGLAAMRDKISGTAAFGGLTRGPSLVNTDVKSHMKQVLEQIESATFAREWKQEASSEGELFSRLKSEEAARPIEAVGARVREMMNRSPENP